MSATRILWIDLCTFPQGKRLSAAVPGHHHLLKLDQVGDVPVAVREHAPQVVCVEFDYPDSARLQVVPELRHIGPALPILMFTEYHSEALAVWAFRSGVWDYRVKPVSDQTLVKSIDILVALSAHGHQRNLFGRSLPADLVAPAGHLRGPPRSAPKTGPAIAYMTAHYRESVRRATLAKLCHLSISEFSRTFRRENGSTFERYLVEYRISRARDLLSDPNNTITQVAFTVGFQSLSYFCRAFRNAVGSTAMSYQRRAQLPPNPASDLR